MKFENVINELVNGKCVKRIHWDKSYIKYNNCSECGKLMFYSSYLICKIPYSCPYIDIIADDWEVIKDD